MDQEISHQVVPATDFYAAIHSPEHWLMMLATILIVGLAVVVHYEVLRAVSAWLPRLAIRNRPRVLIAIFIILGAHVAEIWLFACGIFLTSFYPGLGQVVGIQALGLLDCVYLSAATFTTVGYGDLAPSGALRFLLGSEALAGFVLITWSASFSYLEMQRYWREK